MARKAEPGVDKTMEAVVLGLLAILHFFQK
jgi:hypothetical protein